MATKSESEVRTRTLRVGDEAPDFTLPTHNEGELNLQWYEGRKNVVLAFYPGDWTPLCATQIPGYQALLAEFEQFDAQLLAISVNTIPCHMAWAKSFGGFSFPLMSDFWPHGKVAQQYGVLTDRGYSERVVVLIDKKGIIRYIERAEPGQIPDNNALFRQLALLRREEDLLLARGESAAES